MQGGIIMVGILWAIAVVLFVLWILGFLVFHIAGGLIHILIVIAVIVIIYNIVVGMRRRV
jgi:hypothetical protein